MSRGLLLYNKHMRTVEFRRLLDEANALRVRFELDKGSILKFVVQLECFFETNWVPVVRYDTAHGFAHRDLLHPRQPAEKTEMNVRDFNEGLTLAIFDLTNHWYDYRTRYEKWLNK